MVRIINRFTRKKKSLSYSPRRYSYYYRKVIENYSTYEDLLNLYEDVKNFKGKIFISDVYVSLHGIRMNTNLSDAKKILGDFVELKNPILPEHVILVNKEKVQKFIIRFSFHFFRDLFFYGKLIVVNYSVEAVKTIRDLLLEKHGIYVDEELQDFVIKGRRGVVRFSSIGDSICEYFEDPPEVFYHIKEKLEETKRIFEVSKKEEMKKLKELL